MRTEVTGLYRSLKMYVCLEDSAILTEDCGTDVYDYVKIIVAQILILLFAE